MRMAFLQDLLKDIPEIVLVETHQCMDRTELDKWYESFLAAGQEGQIVRTDSPYENKRSKCLLKRKEFNDAEWVILSVVEGVGNRAGTAGNMTFRTAAGKAFSSNIKGSWEFVADIWQHRAKYVGKKATIRYFGLTPGDNIPRFPYVTAIRDYE